MNMQYRLIPPDELESILPLIRLLNPQLEHAILRTRLQEMIGQGYQCVGAYEGERLIALCGLWIATKFYCSKFIEPDNVIVHPDYRDRGIGQELMRWVYEYGREQGCDVVELNAYVTNSAAHRFYYREGFAILGFHFQKRL